MRNFCLSSVIIGVAPLISNVGINNSWLSSIKISSSVSTQNVVCQQVSAEVPTKTCPKPTITVNSQGKVDLQPHLLDQMSDLLVPQWNRTISRKIDKLPKTLISKNTEGQKRELTNKKLVALVSHENTKLGSKTVIVAKNRVIKPEKRNFPKISRSSLLASSQAKNTCLSQKLRNCSTISNTHFVHPAPDTERVASPFGWRRRPYSGQYQFHQGIDYGAPLGSPVVAAANGIVTKVVSGCLDFRDRLCGNQFGNWVEIDHGNGAIALYGHLLNKSITVEEGMKVWKNQEIARVGSSGWSTGAHLDFRIKVDGEYQNPTSFVR